MPISTKQAFNFIQGSDITGESTFDIWSKTTGNTSVSDFLEYIRSGPKGDAGLSAYQQWLTESGNEGKTFQEFLATFKGVSGNSAYQDWVLIPGNEGKSFEDFINSLQGKSGESVYDIWLALGNTGTPLEFIESLKGSAGESTYDIWKSLGNEGGYQEFINDLKGPAGPAGPGGSSVISGAASTIVDNDLEANKVLVSDGNGKVGVSEVGPTELGYLVGVTSNIQEQLNNKAVIQIVTWEADD